MNTHKYLLPFTVFSACYIETGHTFTVKLFILKKYWHTSVCFGTSLLHTNIQVKELVSKV